MRFLVDRCAGRRLAEWLGNEGHDVPHAGLLRLPNVPAEQRLALAAEVINRHRQALEDRAVVTIRGGRIRISHPPSS